MKKAVDLYLLYQFVRRLTTPFTEWKAYEAGVIDEDGNFIVPKRDRTQEQRDSITHFDKLVLNLKKLIEKVPGGKNKLATYTAALFLLKEGYRVRNEQSVQDLTEEFIGENEGGGGAAGTPTNSMGSGAVADHHNRGIGNIQPMLKRKQQRYKKKKKTGFEKSKKS